MGTIPYGGDELDRVLKHSFPRLSRAEKASLGEMINAELNNQGLSPGNTYQGGPQRQKTGPRGQIALALEKRWQELLTGVKLDNCGTLANPDCLEVISRLLEQTFRNFQLTARRPSHMDPPFTAKIIDEFSTCPVVIPAGGIFTTVVSFSIPGGKYRGVIKEGGQSTDAVVNWDSLTWRVIVDTIPYQPYLGVPMQMWQMVPPTQLPVPIRLRGGQTIALQAANASAADINVVGRFGGWYYPVRSEAGDDSIRSTLVD